MYALRYIISITLEVKSILSKTSIVLTMAAIWVLVTFLAVSAAYSKFGLRYRKYFTLGIESKISKNIFVLLQIRILNIKIRINMMTEKRTIHLIGNAHLDPVWLWDWREGLNEGLTTVRTILDLMDEWPELTFTRGESAIYQHIEREDPSTFARIIKQAEAGRWEVVGGTYIQPDNNLPGTESLARQFTKAQQYFASRFGSPPTIAWAADSFGHSGGLPEIFHSAGIRGFAFTRPEPENLNPGGSVFWWEGTGGSRILACRPTVGWYGTSRIEIPQRLDTLLAESEKNQTNNIACFWGLGNHGGGPTRRQLRDIEQWATKNRSVQVIFSGLHRYFKALLQEEKERGKPYPLYRGELNFTKRGCYTSVAKLKFLYRKSEAQLIRAEKTDSAIQSFLGAKPSDLNSDWETLLFNAFHDILPGTSIERATEEQLAALGGVMTQAQRVEFRALNKLARRIDTSVKQKKDDQPNNVPILVWNPHPHVYQGPVEIEASMDYRPIESYLNRTEALPIEVLDAKGKPLPFQTIATENSYSPELPWRKRVVLLGNLPPLGWSIFQIGLSRQPQNVSKWENPVRGRSGSIKNGIYEITAKKGARSIKILRNGKPFLQGSGLNACTVHDPWGAWGGVSFEAKYKEEIREWWKISGVRLLESGPYRAALWVRLSGEKSRIDLTFSICQGRDAIDVEARVFWNDRSQRLKLNFPGGSEAEYEVPGGSIRRGACGEVPGAGWIRVFDKKGTPLLGFASNAIYGFRCGSGIFSASVVRGTRYADNKPAEVDEKIWQPCSDSGELRFKFLLTHDLQNLPRLAEELEEPLITLPVPPHKGDLARFGSLFSLPNDNVELIALKPAENGSGWVARIQEISGKTVHLRGKWLQQLIDFGTLLPRSLNTFRITLKNGKWSAETINISELPVSPPNR
jgi:alpha-mannosidase